MSLFYSTFFIYINNFLTFNNKDEEEIKLKLEWLKRYLSQPLLLIQPLWCPSQDLLIIKLSIFFFSFISFFCLCLLFFLFPFFLNIKHILLIMVRKSVPLWQNNQLFNDISPSPIFNKFNPSGLHDVNRYIINNNNGRVFTNYNGYLIEVVWEYPEKRRGELIALRHLPWKFGLVSVVSLGDILFIIINCCYL